MKSLLKILESTSSVKKIDQVLAQHRRLVVDGLVNSAKSAVIATLSLHYPATLVITPTDETARSLFDDLFSFLPEKSYYCPPLDLWSVNPDPEASALRVLCIEALIRGEGIVLVASAPAAFQRTRRELQRLTVSQGDRLDLKTFLDLLTELGYERTNQVVVPGQFAHRGGIIDVFPSTLPNPVRIELFDDEVESLRKFNVESQRSIEYISRVEILPAKEMLKPDDQPFTFLELLPPGGLVVLDEPNSLRGHWEEFLKDFYFRCRRSLEDSRGEQLYGGTVPPENAYARWKQVLQQITARTRLYLNTFPRTIPWERDLPTLLLESQHPQRFARRIPSFLEALGKHLEEKKKVVILSEQYPRLLEILQQEEVPYLPGESMESQQEAEVSSEPPSSQDKVSHKKGYVIVYKGRLLTGFVLEQDLFLLYTDTEIFGERTIPRQRRYFNVGQPIASIQELTEGDYVVHISHGIGIYRGMTRLVVEGAEREFLQIDYAGGDKIFVPTDQLDRVQKYIGAEGKAPEINRLGTNTWAKTTERARERAQEIAKDLLELYARRAAVKGYAYSPDTLWQKELEDSFPYQETPDQKKTIEEVKRDLESDRPMDRLVCGDVGFGKTEVAIRAAFKVVQDGKQVAVLVPTTVLAQQHYETFTERMSAFPVRIAMLSRFKTPAEQKEILRGLKDGSIQIVIGTHRLLSRDVQFLDLGLLVIDEEQRFGVVHKEKIKKMRANVDVLTLTATPIPRTLQMALSGIRDLSLINNPPEGRRPILTYCLEYNEDLVRRVILREMDRGGQVYFVFNRVERIERMAEHLRKLLPQARIEIAHGQMAERDLEQVMWDFYHRKFDVLVCTTIIENGLDIPNVNTILIYDADRLGLAQLYQLRGRVGRSNRQAYCYLLYHPRKVLTEGAQKRLQAIRDFAQLGSGLKVAIRDLELRGAGNLLGKEQSGHAEAVGFELYCQMIEAALRELRGLEEEEVLLPPVEAAVSAYIPSEYIPDEGTRFAFYKRLAQVKSWDQLKDLRAEMEDRFGFPPEPVYNILALLRIRLTAREVGVKSISADQRRVRFFLEKLLTREEMQRLKQKQPLWSITAEKIEILIEGQPVLRAIAENLLRLGKFLSPGKDLPPPLPARHLLRKEMTKQRAEAPVATLS